MPMSVREVVMIGRYGLLGLFHRPEKQDWAIVDAALEMVGMTNLANGLSGIFPAASSSAPRLPVVWRRNLKYFYWMNPQLLRLEAQTDILELVKRIHEERQLTTLFVTHDLDALPHTCDRVVLMKEGLIIGDGTPEKLFQRKVSAVFMIYH